MDSERVGRLIELPKAPDAIELRHLRAFVAVAEELNFSRAAERLFITQPALSRQIRTLERLMGVDLLRRSTHRVELTLAGQILLDRSQTVLSDLDDAVHTTQSIGGELDNRVAKLTQPVTDAAGDLDSLRAAYEVLNAQFPIPAEISFRPVNAGGVSSLVLGRALDTQPTMMHLHGGGYALGSALGYRPLSGALAAAANASVLVPDYRLAPEHPYPAAVDDAAAAYRWLVERDVQASEITVVGDSAGGGLAMSLLIRLQAIGVPLPGRVVLLCPWVDFTGRLQREATEPQPPGLAELTQRYARQYLAGHPADDPAVSALHADLTGFPPMLIQVGTGDIVLHECRLLAKRAQDAGVSAHLEVYPVATHVFHLYWSFLPEAAEALEHAAAFITADTVEATRIAT